ncbi:MAG TPA: transglutaminase-like domain-containing protein [Methylomirabilota bacterium]|nr:transglutaminase-like domain-containing protein [Methylomirabilota bacterium]
MIPEERAFYTTQSRMSDAGERTPLLAAFPRDPARPVAAVSRLVLQFVAPLAVTPSPESADDVECRAMSRMLDRILARDASLLDAARPLERRFIGICRNYALLACSALRHHGIPARLRVGFAAYFTPGLHEDHWVCEYHAGDRWRLLDAELSDRVRAHFGVDFDAADVPRDVFLVAGEAWARARRGALDPGTCGVSAIGISGPQFLASSVVRDLAALNKREMLAWDVWGLARGLAPGAPIPERTATRPDAVATLIAAPDPGWRALREAYEDEGLRVPRVVLSFTDRGPIEVAVDV